MRIVYVMGARPNIVKMAPVIAALREALPDAAHVIVHTGQHYDRMMSDVFLQELRVPAPNHMLGVGSASHAVQTARIMDRIEPVLESERPDLVVVPGDVNSTMAAALVTVKLGIPLAHIESGLRSFDRTMPEEINRIVTDQFSDYLFLHSEPAIDNLRREGIEDDRMHFVGNTMIDALMAVETQFRSAGIAARFGLSPHDYLLVTLHRPALVDGAYLADALSALREVARELPVLFPAHPRAQKRLAAEAPKTAVQIVHPVGYLDFLSLEADAAAVLTDSGGVQEETTFLGVPCFTLRDTTERPITIERGTNTLLGLAPERIAEIPSLLEGGRRESPEPPPLWDGRSAERVADVIAAATEQDQSSHFSEVGSVPGSQSI
jgi:UDP-N-acetylglucosamine 2-epimerase (non-hydrolysing)